MELTRKQLYDEIWTISAAGVSRKYDIPYAQLTLQLKAANIPIPPSGYWTKLEFGKPIEKIALTGNYEEVVSLEKKDSGKKHRIVPAVQRAKEVNPKPIARSQPDTSKPKIPPKAAVQELSATAAPSAVDLGEPEVVQQCGRTYNVYDRATLYQEVWTAPVTEVAKKYKVSDVAIHKVCKTLDIPVPPRGYWAKLRAGKAVTKTPLPESKAPERKTGPQTGRPEISPATTANTDVLAFLDEAERVSVLAAADQIRIPGENERMHTKIIAHRKSVASWKKLNRERADWSPQVRKRNMPPTPLLAEGIAEESIPRACHILDTLIKNMEPLGCSLTDDLGFLIRGETVKLAFRESQDKTDHILTKEENRQLIEYEDRRKRDRWASKPTFRKYDYIYNGTLSLVVSDRKSVRDCKAYRIEDRLGDVILEMYVEAEDLHQARLAREEAERQRQEEAKRKEERRNRYNAEVERTLALKHIADDYAVAVKIRNFVAAYVEAHPNEDTSEFQAWANSKADWYDPTVAKTDEILGKRDHEQSEAEKTLKKRSNYGWW